MNVQNVGTPQAAKVATATAVAILLAAYLKNERKVTKEDDKKNNMLLRYNGKDKQSHVGKVIGTVSEINIFPGKSMAGCGLKQCRVDHAGLQGDRLIMVVKVYGNNHRVVATQRTLPQLARIKATLNDTYNGVTLSLPSDLSKDSDPCYLDLSKVDTTSETVVIDLHTLKAPCVDLGDEAASWINNALTKLSGGNTKKGFRVFALAPNQFRRVAEAPAGLLMEGPRPFDATSFSDMAPLTFASEASLRALNSAASEAVPMDRFRTNIVAQIDDNELAFLEDHVLTLQIGSALVFRSIGPTFRCVIPSVDQETGEAGFQKGVRQAEPVATLRRLRSGGIRFGLTGLLPPSDGGSKGLAPLFGIYLGVDKADTSGQVSVGDPIRILEYKKEAGMGAQVMEIVEISFNMVKYGVTLARNSLV